MRIRGCEVDDNAGVGDKIGVVATSAEHDYVGGTRCSGIMYSAANVLGMSVVCGMRGVGEMCEMCMYLDGGGVVGVEGG